MQLKRDYNNACVAFHPEVFFIPALSRREKNKRKRDFDTITRHRLYRQTHFSGDTKLTTIRLMDHTALTVIYLHSVHRVYTG